MSNFLNFIEDLVCIIFTGLFIMAIIPFIVIVLIITIIVALIFIIIDWLRCLITGDKY